MKVLFELLNPFTMFEKECVVDCSAVTQRIIVLSEFLFHHLLSLLNLFTSTEVSPGPVPEDYEQETREESYASKVDVPDVRCEDNGEEASEENYAEVERGVDDIAVFVMAVV